MSCTPYIMAVTAIWVVRQVMPARDGFTKAVHECMPSSPCGMWEKRSKSGRYCKSAMPFEAFTFSNAF